jgi:hypothetical protein
MVSSLGNDYDVMTSSLACISVSGCLTFALVDTPTDVISIIHTVFCQNTMIVTAALNPDPTLVSLAGTMAPLASVGLFLAPSNANNSSCHEGKDCRKLAITASYNNA